MPPEAIAKDAGVGIGTLYRHFPKREALVEAVYEDQVERLAASARELLADHPPAEAFQSWMTLFIDWAAAKHGMIDTVRALMSSGRVEHGQMRAQPPTTTAYTQTLNSRGPFPAGYDHRLAGTRVKDASGAACGGRALPGPLTQPARSHEHGTCAEKGGATGPVQHTLQTPCGRETAGRNPA